MSLINTLINSGWLRSPRIIKAFQKIKRMDFLLAEEKDLAELNEALPIGRGQTISQPLVVAFMLELLSPQLGEKILDIGSGSGWTSALLAELVGEKGKIIALEIELELKELGERNAAKYNFVDTGRIKFVCADGSEGYEPEAPFDKILVSAESDDLLTPWKKQLKIGGRIVLPIGSSIKLFIKKGENDFESADYPGFVFVPLVKKI